MLVVEDKLEKIINIVAEILEGHNIGCLEDDDYIYNDWDSVILNKAREIDPEIEVTNGASKMVIIPSFGNLVIKIPLMGCWCDDGYYDEEKREWVEGEWVFDAFTGANGGSDYCALETEMYYEFIEERPEFAFLFPETDFYKKIKGTLFYIQTKCGTDLYKEGEKISDNSRELGKKLYRNRYVGNELWVQILVERVGEEKAQEVLDFVDYNVSDLHSGNLGINLNTGMPMIIDFSGFFS